MEQRHPPLLPSLVLSFVMVGGGGQEEGVGFPVLQDRGDRIRVLIFSLPLQQPFKRGHGPTAFWEEFERGRRGEGRGQIIQGEADEGNEGLQLRPDKGTGDDVLACNCECHGLEIKERGIGFSSLGDDGRSLIFPSLISDALMLTP